MTQDSKADTALTGNTVAMWVLEKTEKRPLQQGEEAQEGRGKLHTQRLDPKTVDPGAGSGKGENTWLQFEAGSKKHRWGQEDNTVDSVCLKHN